MSFCRGATPTAHISITFREVSAFVWEGGGWCSVPLTLQDSQTFCKRSHHAPFWWNRPRTEHRRQRSNRPDHLAAAAEPVSSFPCFLGGANFITKHPEYCWEFHDHTSERLSPEPILKKEASPSRTEGERILEASNALNYRVWGIPAVLSRGIPGNGKNRSEAWGPPQFQEKRSRSENAILGALGEFRGILGLSGPQLRLRAQSRSRTRLRIAASIAFWFCVCFKGVFDTIAPLSRGWAPQAV